MGKSGKRKGRKDGGVSDHTELLSKYTLQG